MQIITTIAALLLAQVCGDNIIDRGENCDTCPEDVVCLSCETCFNGQCIPAGACTCGDGQVDPGENCETCVEDVPCPPDTKCVDGKCISPCNPGVAPMEIVIVMDTSGSMIYEANQLCDGITQLESDLIGNGLDVTVTLLSIAIPSHPAFDCLETSVNEMFSYSLQLESWGTATEIIAYEFPWQTDRRIIVPIADEGPYEGMPCDGEDEFSIMLAIMGCLGNNVIVSPIITDFPCAITLGQLLADETGGIMGAGGDIIGNIHSLIDATLCGCTGDLDNDGVVGISDFLLLLAGWGIVDLDGDGDTDVVDILLMFSNWGPCK